MPMKQSKWCDKCACGFNVSTFLHMLLSLGASTFIRSLQSFVEIFIQLERISHKFHVINCMTECVRTWCLFLWDWKFDAAYHSPIEWIWSHLDLLKIQLFAVWYIYLKSFHKLQLHIGGYLELECYTNISVAR